MTGVDVVAGWTAVRRRIDAACERNGRDPAGVRLLPVSKRQPAAAVRALYAAGVRRFGENLVQAIRGRHEEFADDLPDLEWAAIGHLQTNKAGPVAELASEFQALDSPRIAAALQRRLTATGRSLDVLIQVNTSGEQSKFGVAPTAVAELAATVAEHDRLRVRGLMTLAATGGDDVAGRCFARLAEVRAGLLADGVPGEWSELSMGMSGDFETAIAHGSTCVRVGTAIFGARDDT